MLTLLCAGTAGKHDWQAGLALWRGSSSRCQVLHPASPLRHPVRALTSPVRVRLAQCTDVLRVLVLPKLGLRDAQALSQTCRALRATVISAEQELSILAEVSSLT